MKMISSLPLTPGLTPAENVPLLAGANLYMDAVGSCQIYTLPASLVSVVQTEQLRQRRRHCLGLGWQRTDKLEAGRQAGRRARTRWRPLLEHIVTRQEARGQTSLHGAVLCKLAQARCAAPPWLLAGYKKRDTAELIRVYHQLGYIEMAGEVAIQYIQAVMAEGAEYFGLEETLGKDGLTAASKSPAWVPWTVLDRLVLELRENSEHSGVKQVLETLQAVMEVYLQRVEDVSRQMINVRAG